MPIIGYNISSISISRRRIKPKKLNINSTIKIKSVSERRINKPSKKLAIGVDFEFFAVYKPKLAELKIIGEVLYSNGGVKKIVNEWDKRKKLPEKIDMEVKNFLFRKCLTIGINLAQELQLPPPIMFPAIVPKKDPEETRYIG